MPEISVIVPIYKVEKYLHHCVESILLQTFTNFELILVDDGSPDNCGAICDEYAKKDNRIRVIHKENGWLSSARNAGTELASGKYITFIDGDDWIRPDYLQTLYTNLISYDADISMVKPQIVYDSTCIEPAMSEQITSLDNREALEHICTERTADLKAAWAKLISADIVRKFPFPTDRFFAEDMAVTYLWVVNSKRVVLSNLQKYCYRKNTNGITNKPYGKFRLGNLLTLNEMRDFFKKEGYDQLYAQFTYSYAIDLCSQHNKVLEHLKDYEIADKLKVELARIIKEEGQRCGITIKTAPQCYELLYPKAMELYWKLLYVRNKVYAVFYK